MRPEAATLMTGLDAFLAAHGHLGQGFDDLAMPSWAEEPDLLLTELAKRVEHPPAVGAGERRERQAAEAEVLAAGGPGARWPTIRARLDRFEALLGFARLIGPLTEVHNYWIDRMAQSSLRRFVMRVGGRLRATGVIDRPDDVLYPATRRDPGAAPAAGGSPRRSSSPAARSRPVGRRSQPPRKIGAPIGGRRARPLRRRAVRVDRAGRAARHRSLRRDRSRTRPGDPQPGRFRGGPAGRHHRVRLRRTRPGCRSSRSPAGLITNTGGVLSHAAVVAREFALPAVVGTGDATQRIADGRLVELDGSTRDRAPPVTGAASGAAHRPGDARASPAAPCSCRSTRRCWRSPCRASWTSSASTPSRSRRWSPSTWAR